MNEQDAKKLISMLTTEEKQALLKLLDGIEAARDKQESGR